MLPSPSPSSSLLLLLATLAIASPATAEETSKSSSSTATTKDAAEAAKPKPLAEKKTKPEDAPFRLVTEFGLPDWFHLSGSYRARQEYVTNQFRTGITGDNSALSLRGLLLAELRHPIFVLGAEAQDSRALLADDEAPIDTTVSNAIDLIQAYAGLKLESFIDDGKGLVKLGRFTRDLGSRRLVARNRFRNTINAFTGIELDWKATNGFNFFAMSAIPVQRRPLTRDELEDNEAEADREHEEVLFSALFLASPKFSAFEFVAEAWLYHLYETDARDQPSTNRRLFTPGFRFFRSPKKGTWDLEIEAAYQFGESRSSTAASNRSDLDHRAFLVHAALGYSFDLRFSPRVVLQYDYASGDDNPNDGKNTRFDTLFGARRFEFGPTGLWGAIARSNINTPGLRIEGKPYEGFRAFVAWRPYWLAEKRDAWVGARVRDASGRSGRFVGNQVEGSLSWDIIPESLILDLGAVALFRGEFAREAPNSNKGGEHAMTYAELSLFF